MVQATSLRASLIRPWQSPSPPRETFFSPALHQQSRKAPLGVSVVPLHDISRKRLPVARRIPTPRYVPFMAFHPPSTVCSAPGLTGLFHPAAVSRVHPSGVRPPMQSRAESSSTCALMTFATPPNGRNRRALPLAPACHRGDTGRSEPVFKALLPAPGMTATTGW